MNDSQRHEHAQRRHLVVTTVLLLQIIYYKLYKLITTFVYKSEDKAPGVVNEVSDGSAGPVPIVNIPYYLHLCDEGCRQYAIIHTVQ